MSTSDRGGHARWPREWAALIAAQPREQWPEWLEKVPVELQEIVRHHLQRLAAPGESPCTTNTLSKS